MPTVSASCLALAAFGVLYYALTSLYCLFLHPLRNIPGPLLAKFSKAWINRHYFACSWHTDVLKLHARYGPVVRITPNEVSFVDAAGYKQLYGYGKPNQKSPWYGTWEILCEETTRQAVWDVSAPSQTWLRRVRSRYA